MPAKKALELPCSVRLEHPGHLSSSRKNKGLVSAVIHTTNNGKGRDVEEKEMWVNLLTKSHTRKFKWSKMERMFVLNVSEGKSTIRFGEPYVDVIIADADPALLQKLLMILTGRPIRLNAVAKNVSIGSLKSKTISDLKRDIFDAKLKDVPSVEATDLQLKAVYPQILNRPNMVKLNVSRNSIAVLPPYSWNKLERLAYLDLSRNQLRRLPGEIFTTELRHTLLELNLSRNSLKALPPQLFHMQALQRLDVSYNELVELPSSFGCNPNLQCFSLENNPLTWLPATFLRVKLVDLRYGRNLPAIGNLNSVPVDVFDALPARIRVRRISSLKNLAAQVVLKNRPDVGVPDLPTEVMVHLGRAQRCFVCSRLHYLSYLTGVKREVEARFLRALTVTTLTTEEIPVGSLVLVRYDVCSEDCVRRFSFPKI